MKQTLIALLAIALLASCQQNTEEAKESMKDRSGAPSYENLYISETEGNQLITNYHEHLKSEVQKSLPEGDTVSFDSLKQHRSLAFMINAKELKDYLKTFPDVTTLNIYLARTQADDLGKMTLVYVGAKDSTAANGETVHVELVQYKESDPTHNDPQVMDNVIPCPDCDRSRIHTNQ